MKVKERLKKIAKIAILTSIIILGLCLININEIQAAIVSSSAKGEVFWEDKQTAGVSGIVNWNYIPVRLFQDYNITLWCSQHNHDSVERVTASEKHYIAYQKKTQAVTTYSFFNPYCYYRHSPNMGLIPDHTAEHAKHVRDTKNAMCCQWYSPDEYEGDDQPIIDQLNETLPGIGKNAKLRSVEYVLEKTLDALKHQDGLYVLTAQKLYDTASEPLWRDSLSAEEMEKGYFTHDEKQTALWTTSLGKDGGTIGDRPASEVPMRNLDVIAAEYNNFYNTIHNEAGEDKYEDIVEGYTLDEDKREKEYVEETKEEFEGEELKTFKFKNTLLQYDKKEECYVLGPYNIDYSVNDETADIYHSTATNEVKFNAIEKITVYNQDKKNIETLGGSFKIMYKYNGEVTEEDEGKVLHIQDEFFYEKADGEEVDGFESNKTFYIVVKRGTMKPEDFKGFYAKVDFQYLERITGSIYKYRGDIYEYYYTCNVKPKTYRYTYTGLYSKPYGPYSCGGCEGDEESGYSCPGNHYDHDTETGTVSTQVVRETYEYELLREKLLGTTAQKMAGYGCDGNRIYKKYSILITSEWDWETPEIRLHKVCDTKGEDLYGAKFNVTLDIKGTDIHKNEINKTIKLTRTTDKKGYAYITSADIEANGVYLGTFTGTIDIKLEEKGFPAGHRPLQETLYATLELEKGKITSGSRDGDLEISGDNAAEWTIYNKEIGTPIIQVAKVDASNHLLSEAYFEIHVSYTEGAVKHPVNNDIVKPGKLIDKKENIIRGQTNGGILNLTVEDFANMKYGFNIAGYTGEVTLDIVEITSPGSFSITSSSKDITLKYVDGFLIDYTEFTDKSVIIHYLYDNVLQNIYKFATGEISYNQMAPAIRQTLNDWVRKQQANTDLSEDDILAWLVKYIESSESDNLMDVCTKVSNQVSTGPNGQKIVQVVVEDSRGDLPDIPRVPTPKPDPLFMRIAGTVFLDDTETKDSAHSANGKLDEGEELLYGVEVTLYEENGSLAKLTEKDGEIRTNPTMTDENGFYEFRGVDPFKKYYVEFKYNGVEYKNTASGSGEYNSDTWAVSSKGSELSGDRSGLNSRFSEINYASCAYDYYEIQGLYAEIWARTLAHIRTANEYPDISMIHSQVQANHADDPDISRKMGYIKAAEIKAYAGYSSAEGGIGSPTGNGLYPYYEMGKATETSMNFPGDEMEFAGDKVKKLYPGQLQIHLGLVERDSIDLSLKTDIVKTTVSMNKYDTTYNYHQGLNAYHQYIYEEDYNYAKEYNTNGIAFYTEDNVDLYMTYEIVINNATSIPAAATEIVDYYNSKFSYNDGGYVTTKGNRIDAMKINGKTVSGMTSNFGSPLGENNTSNGKYKTLFINLGRGYMLSSPEDEVKIEITFKMTDPSGHATEVLKEMLLGGEGTEKRVWEIGNYAEISAYATEDGYLDSDSHPGNFSIENFEKLNQEYIKAYWDYVINPSEDNSRAMKLALGRLTDSREDDAWYEGLTIENSRYRREITGNVWEAITDEVKSSLNLQKGYGDRILTHDGKSEKALGGIKVELVELLKDGDTEKGQTQIVRGVTTTRDDGSYKFEQFIAGDYTVRFIYGDYANVDETIYSKVSTTTFEKGDKDYLPINGQYYQSTKANPDSNNEQYWYKQKNYNEADTRYDDITNPRYSDAYDDAYTRLSQMNSNIINTTEDKKQTSSEYDYQGVQDVQSTRHTDPIYAYTSTMEIEIEYIRPDVSGNSNNRWYEYKIGEIDFGITPRAYNDINVDKFVSNIKLYAGDGNLIVNSKFDEEGKVIEVEGSNIIRDKIESNGYLAGLTQIEYNELLLNNARLEITYTIKVTNNSLHDGDKYDTIKYITYRGEGQENTVAIVYYDEDVEKLVAYETLREGNALIYHNKVDKEKFSTSCLAGENRYDREGNYRESLKDYSKVIGYNVGKAEIIKSNATNIVDYPNAPLDFVQVNHAKEQINGFWTKTEPKEFISSREKYKSQEGTDLIKTYSQILRATDNSPLYNKLIPGESITDELTLSLELTTSTSGTNDFEFSNLVELTKVANDAGKILDLEGYDITGKQESETSEVRKTTDVDGDMPKYTPTISTGKSPTVIIRVPSGLNFIEDSISANLGIVLIVLVVLAVGLILIKKFVLVSPNKE